jgi:SAM-dependent methyltransferase
MNATEAYHDVRQREGRLLADDVVRGLPKSGLRTAHPQEWRVRARSLQRVIRMLNDRPRAILEAGCGNGWFSARLAEAGHSVTGLDTGATELEQAKRVFAERPITWILGDPWTDLLPVHTFDLVLFAASIQYFPDLHVLFRRCYELLKEGGEILIIDSHVYPDAEAAEQAHKRSTSYYASVGTPEMAGFYHHHTYRALTEACGGAVVEIIPPRRKVAALLLGRFPFPVVRIRP